ncbi:MAG: molybdenum cofactor guanylyltransferase [Candidatus Aminicenantales bacterium]
MESKISCIVLAGGKGSRLEGRKILETVGGRTLLERVVNAVSPYVRNIIIVGAAGQTFPFLDGCPKMKAVMDVYPDKGALGGLYTGLAASSSFHNLVVGSDMPFLNRELLCYQMQLADGFDAVVPRLNNWIEPLHAIYAKTCIAPLKKQLRQNALKVGDLFSMVRVRYVEAEEIDLFDPAHLSVFNVNTKTDLAEARNLSCRLDVFPSIQ